MTLKELMSLYFRLNLRIRDEKTRKQYRIAERQLCKCLGRESTVDDLTDDGLLGFASWMLANGLAERTVNDKIGRLVALWKWSAARKIVDRWPTWTPIPTPVADPRAWSQVELERLVAAARAMRGNYHGARLADYWLGLLLVCWDTGCRTSELLSLRWEWLDWSSSILSVPAHARKGKRKPAVYWLKPHTLAVLLRMRKESGVIFPTPASASSFYHRWKNLLQKAGLPTGRSEGPQKLRRSYATWIAASGGDATAALGHSSPAIARKHYLDRRIVEKPQNAVLFRIG